jgi:hypothetical protein
MTILRQALDKLQLTAFHPTAARTATGNGTAVDVQTLDGDLFLVLDSAAGTGTTPTLDVKIQSSDTSGGTYTDITGATFTQVTGTASQQAITISKDEARRWIRIVYTVGGSTPSFTFSVNAVGVKKYG